jgi:hypothetical protein
MDAIAPQLCAWKPLARIATVLDLILSHLNGISRFVSSKQWPITDAASHKLSVTLIEHNYTCVFRHLLVSVTLSFSLCDNSAHYGAVQAAEFVDLLA